MTLADVTDPRFTADQLAILAAFESAPTPPEVREAAVVEEVARAHELKTWPEFFEAVASGAKPFEVRRDDRGYQVGDTVRLREYHPPVRGWGAAGGYTGREITRHITYVFDGSGLDNDSVQPGYVVLGLAPIAAVAAYRATDGGAEEAVRRVEALAEELANPHLHAGLNKVAKRIYAALAPEAVHDDQLADAGLRLSIGTEGSA